MAEKLKKCPQNASEVEFTAKQISAEYKIIDNTDDHWCSFAKQKKRLTSENH